MKLTEATKGIKGELEITLIDTRTGTIKESYKYPNLIVNTGLNWMVDRYTDTPDVMSHMAVGSGNTGVLATDVALQSELVRKVLANTSVLDNTVTYSAFFAAGEGTGAITEAGIFNAEIGGIMLNRAKFGVVTKEELDGMQIIWVITQTAV